MKDRIALKMIEDAEKQGLIEPGKSTLVEATSGNTGIAVAMLGAAKGYKVVIAMPRLQSMHERYCVIKKFWRRDSAVRSCRKGARLWTWQRGMQNAIRRHFCSSNLRIPATLLRTERQEKKSGTK